LLIGTVPDNRVADKLRAHAEDTREFITDHSDFLHDHAGGHPIHVAASPFFRIAAAHEITSGGFLQKLFRKLDFVCIHIQDHLARHPFYKITRFIPDF
jgi:hypothetical protein